MRVVALVILVLALAACTGGSGPAAAISPSAAVSSAPSSAPSANPGGWAANCRLPVTWGVPNGNTVTPKAGFLTFPDRALAEDATAPVNSTFYDRALSRWLPAQRAAVSPDGKRYAYTEGNAYQGINGKVHVVDLTTGADTVIYSGGAVYSVVDFGSDGIYLTLAAPEGAPRGLWLENPAGGQPRLISSTLIAPAVGGGAAWGIDFNPADPSPNPGGIEGPRNEVLRMDLRTGATSVWFYRPGANVYLDGFDAAGHPFVNVEIEVPRTDPAGGSTFELWLLKSQGSATSLFSDKVVGELRMSAVDSYGVWFAGVLGPGGNVWLYENGTLAMVATVPVDYFNVAGGCIPQS